MTEAYDIGLDIEKTAFGSVSDQAYGRIPEHYCPSEDDGSCGEFADAVGMTVGGRDVHADVCGKYQMGVPCISHTPGAAR